MVIAFLTHLFVFSFGLIVFPRYRSFIKHSFKVGATSWWKLMILGLFQYGFPHSMIALGQRSVSSTTVTVVQPLVPTASLFFASIFLPDERFTWLKLIPHRLALFGCGISCIPLSSRPPQTLQSGTTCSWSSFLSSHSASAQSSTRCTWSGRTSTPAARLVHLRGHFLYYMKFYPLEIILTIC